MAAPDFVQMGLAAQAVPELQNVFNVLRVNLIYVAALTCVARGPCG